MQRKNTSTAFTTITSVSVLIALYLYRPWGLFFLNDDLVHIPLSADGVFGQRNSVRLFNDFTIYIDSLIYDKNAVGYHATNLLIHLLCSVALFTFITQLHKRQMHPFGKYFAWLTAAVFFCYPFHSESIFWIIGRGSSVSTLLLLLTFMLFLNKEEHFIWGIISLVPFTIALFTYESVWCFPIILFFLASFNIRHQISSFKKEAAWFAAYLFVFSLFFLYRHQVTGEIIGAYEQNGFQKNGWIVLPQNLARLMLRSLTPPMQNSTLFAFVGALLLTTVTYGAVQRLRKNSTDKKWLLAVCACLIFSLIPYLTLGIDTHGTESERFLYLPSVFICLLIASLIISISNKIMQATVTTMVCIYFIVSLSITSTSYRTASTVVSNTISLLQQVPKKKYVVLKNVPREYRGAVMLQLGLHPGWRWLKQHNYPDSLFIESFSSNDHLFQQTAIRYDSLVSDVHMNRYYSEESVLIEKSRSFQRAETAIISYDSVGITIYR